ncbi:lysylphosphatidylglycerol synthase transmembrane domain-containing protein [Methanoculleus sp.]|uniref:lysylphosphatidylglycerol synthase transmembrane domain-containing protein n=1 Tax=Methanoculleus sp. TaxID=90427 RepID=UPI002633FE9C|nr:lysylphosphatidylglycerol synthase transmembrane domain-containing protein [Methanoculleus sp.]MDI6720630.1 lysylphosphatidylglycerol synthase transmembrane domain-containing protein [Methanomicrobiales archaeon]MDI6867872.1 lysylphosphatidylglycerol synthase transmembrane domain-containing protein [Methanoculleus sp.]
MWRKVSAILIPSLVAFGILAYMLWRVWDDLMVTIAHIHPLYLAFAVLICALAWVMRGWRYRAILGGLTVRLGLTFSTACILLSQTANLIVPARLGDLVRIFILKHEGLATYSQGVSSLIVERIFDVVTIALLGLLALPFVIGTPEWFLPLIVIPIVGGAAFAIFLLLTGNSHSENKYLGIFYSMLTEVRAVSLSMRSAFVLGSSSIGIWLMDVLVCAVVVMMFGESIPFMVIMLAIVIGNLIKAVPITPGGVGTYEFALAITFELAGMAPATATVIAVIDHLVKNLVTLVGGVASLYYFGDWSVNLMKHSFWEGLSEEELHEP